MRNTMSNRFLHIVESAKDNKQLFESSMMDLKDSLNESVRDAAFPEAKLYSMKAPKTETTGWLRGALSYPWVVVCIVVPAIMDTLF